MRNLRAVGVVGGALAAALGASIFACGGTGTVGVFGGDEGGSGFDGSIITDGGGGSDASDGGTTSHPGTCTNPHPLVVAGKNTGFVSCDEGYQHRMSVADCPSLAPRVGVQCGGGGGIDAGQECGVDSDCTAKPNGVCRATAGGRLFCGCVYGCVRDSDCAAGGICECGNPVGFCVTAKCKTDGDCGPSSLCASAPSGFGGCGGTANIYLCQTTRDKCSGPKDCSPPKGPSAQVCGFDEDAGARACGEGPLACP